MTYAVLTDQTAHGLAEQVNGAQADGWAPFGSVSVAFCGWVGYGPHEGEAMYYFAQAMTKEDKKK